MKPLSPDSIKRRWLRGTLETLRENTSGGDELLVELMGKLDRKEFRWTGKLPTSRRSKT